MSRLRSLEVIGEQAEIAHAKTGRHLTLEAVDVLLPCPGDDQVVYIHAVNEVLLPPSLRVQGMLDGTFGEVGRADGGVELHVLGSSLPQLLEALA